MAEAAGRAMLPEMYRPRAGKVVVYGSATGVRALEGVSACSGRWAQ
jgi:hypothetical protein